MATLSVNVNKLATLRNSRGGNNPDVLAFVLEIISYGAHGITVHPRPDGRHIRREDVYCIAGAIQVELNIEGYPDAAFLELVTAVKPAQCTLVPDPPHVLTSNAGWQVAKNMDFLKDVVRTLQAQHIRTSLFVDPDALSPQDQRALVTTGTDRVELYTEAYATHFGTKAGEAVLRKYQTAAAQISVLGIGLNAGHDLNLSNLKPFLQAIPMIQEVSIGHALICDALRFGMQETITRYLACLSNT